MKPEREWVFVAWVQDRPGVLTRIAGAFFRRGINIVNLTVGTTHHEGVSKMVIRTRAPESSVNRLKHALDRLVDVLLVELQDPEREPAMELCFLRLEARDEDARERVIDATRPFRPTVVSVEANSVVLELIAAPATVDEFVRTAGDFRIIDVSRTGVTTIPSTEPLGSASED